MSDRRPLDEVMQEQIRKSVLSYAVFRPESAIVVAMTILFVWLSLSVSWFPGTWWLWLIFGLIGETLIVLTTLRDKKFHQKVFEELTRQKFDLGKLRAPELRQKLAKALEYRTSLFKEIEREENAVLDDHLLNIARGLDDWIAQIYRLAQGLDAYGRDAIVKRDTQIVPQELAQFKRALSQEGEGSVRQELEKSVELKQAQWDTLKNLRDTMARAQLQLENTLSAMGTIYTQAVLLGSKDVDSGRAQRLQADMAEQVRALEDVSAAMSEVYQASGQGETYHAKAG